VKKKEQDQPKGGARFGEKNVPSKKKRVGVKRSEGRKTAEESKTRKNGERNAKNARNDGKQGNVSLMDLGYLPDIRPRIIVCSK